MKKGKFTKIAAGAASGLVLVIASAVAAAPCAIFYHQPETPRNIKSRLAALKDEK
jgi:cyclic lactone autoinducer peptide